ncbi:GNAT family N-acetyltransferase [Nocardia alni]|uniref:GNAT family N-acetyltransferase n=1 Tax=Nocardia alni TaxID=2815723 RepID=UPI001C22BE11|nr:GNAT family N-acetyltransferase [Nocardia alni]
MDEPIEPPDSPGTHRLLLTGDWEGAPGEVWYLPNEFGGAVAYYRLDLPDLENLDRAFVYLFTHPALRRQGAGRALLRHAAERAAAHGRMVLDGVTPADSAGDAFARSTGATLAFERARRVQELREIPPERVAEMRAEAERKATGYSLVTWTGPVPDEHAAGYAGALNAYYADAPHAEGVQPEVWDADRVRQRTGMLLRAGHLRGYSVAAVREATGEMAAITELTIDPDEPEWAYQHLTAVTRPHRGHRLGILVKTAMMQLLAETEPRLKRIRTRNGADNEHMIAVNETLGHRLTRSGPRFYEIPVTDVK